MEKVRRCGSSHSQHESIFKQTAGTIKRVGVFHWINTRLVMEILLNLISSPLKLITISYMRYYRESSPYIICWQHVFWSFTECFQGKRNTIPQESCCNCLFVQNLWQMRKAQEWEWICWNKAAACCKMAIMADGTAGQLAEIRVTLQ